MWSRRPGIDTGAVELSTAVADQSASNNDWANSPARLMSVLLAGLGVVAPSDEVERHVTSPSVSA